MDETSAIPCDTERHKVREVEDVLGEVKEGEYVGEQRGYGETIPCAASVILGSCASPGCPRGYRHRRVGSHGYSASGGLRFRRS